MTDQTRSIPQNSSLHKWLSELAIDLTKAGWTEKRLLKEVNYGFNIPWSVKSLTPLFRAIIKPLYDLDNFESMSPYQKDTAMLLFANQLPGSIRKPLNCDISMNGLIRLLAIALNDAGYTKHVLLNHFKTDYELPITMDSLKEMLKCLLPDLYGKTSTAKLTTKEMMNAYQVFDHLISEATGIHVEWPSLESQSNEALRSYYDQP